MNPVKRYNKYKNDDFDRVLLLIKEGVIKCGRYSNLVKYDKDKKIKGEEFFTDGDKEDKRK